MRVPNAVSRSEHRAREPPGGSGSSDSRTFPPRCQKRSPSRSPFSNQDERGPERPPHTHLHHIAGQTQRKLEHHNPVEAAGAAASTGRRDFVRAARPIPGLTIINARHVLDRDGRLIVTVPETVEASAAELAPALQAA
jgi:hypothetical protein